MSLIVRQISIKAKWQDVSLVLWSYSCTEAISIASTSLKQRQSISLALLLQCAHFRSSRPELFCEKRLFFDSSQVFHRVQKFPVNFAKFSRTPFFTEHIQWLLLAFSSIKISFSDSVCIKLASEGWRCLVSFYDEEWWSKRLQNVFSSE